jgi:LuxR family maltose regulon positive regulatory protein
MLTDDDEAAASDFRRAAPENRAFRNGLELADLGHLSLIAGDAGRWDEAEAHVAEAARIAGTYELGDCLPGVPARLARDRLCARGGDDDAAADLEELADQLDREFCPWLRIEAAMLCAEAALDRGDVSNAAHWLGEARAGPAGWAQAPGLRRRLEELEGRHVAQASVEPLTPAEVRVLTLLPTNLTVPEIAARLGVSRNTVGTHVKAIHRKLGASHRSHAVERAVELGLVPGRPPAG